MGTSKTPTTRQPSDMRRQTEHRAIPRTQWEFVYHWRAGCHTGGLARKMHGTLNYQQIRNKKTYQDNVA